MLQKNKMVRKAIEKMYDGVMTISEMQKTVRSNHSTSFSPVVILEDQPCRLSFSSSPSASGSDPAVITQTVKLFYAPEIDIKEGSRITVTQNGHTEEYKRSGTVARYTSHNEVVVELFDGWS